MAQETFIKAYINLRSFKGAAGFSTWLYRIAYNVFYDFTRKTDRVTSSDDMAEIAENEMLHHISENIHRKIDIFESLKILRVEEKTAVLLFYMEDLPHEKIAAIMNCPLGTVKSYLLRSKEKLATYFKNSGYERSI